ncbi:MAG: hypothetical protein EXQ58_12990 [Acidobacteria bacterium]|nr:hypothetical protein [Acidobacteriota bacterium]
MFFLGRGSQLRHQTMLWRLAVLMLPAAFYAPMPALTQSSKTPATVPPAASDAAAFLPVDYLPLNLGNRWIYTKAESRFKKTDTVRIEIISAPIIRRRTWYIFNQLSFAPGLESANNVPIRYDADTKRFVRLAQEGEMPLFPVGEDSDASFDASVDENGRAVPNRMSYLTCADCTDSGMEMVFDRGMGVTAIQVTHPGGTESYELKSAEVNQRKFGAPIPVNKPKEPGAKPTGPVISRADPTLILTVEKKDNGAHFRLKVQNPTESFLSFNFNSSQKHDFVVREKESGFEIWRWSKGMFFTQVVRNQALLPEKEWEFEFFWDFKDNERNDIQKGEYFVSGILTTRDPRESEPVILMVP